ncbi:MAG: hypothetical protein K0R67_1053, partial [Paenibacillus sp.]|nr:hypothetical protein [Paenibacillus sp.]
MQKNRKSNNSKPFKLFLVTLLATTAIVGCSKSGSESSTETPKVTAVATPKETPYIEIWGNSGNFKNAIKKDSPYSKWMIEKVGVGYHSPLVPWEGGT